MTRPAPAPAPAGSEGGADAVPETFRFPDMTPEQAEWFAQQWRMMEAARIKPGDPRLKEVIAHG